MAKHFFHRNRKRAIVALSIALSATLSLSMLAACANTEETPEEDDEVTSSTTDTQLLRNGNFEFYGEMNEKLEDKRSFISTPTSWTFTSGSPSSNTASGIVEADEWEHISQSSYRLVPEDAEAQINPEKGTFTAVTLTDEVAAEARAHWEEASVYDHLIFYKYYGIDSASEFDLYGDYTYSIDYEDVQYFATDIKDEAGESRLALHDDENQRENGDTGVLMIHNKRSSDGVMGTAQYYTSSTTITLEAGTAAELSVWVRTDKLYHYYTAAAGEEKEELERRGGAYISVINTVGGTDQGDLQIKNINTKGDWEQYTVYIRANTFATTTFRVRLGLGQGTSSDNRYEAVDGYAFFDDVKVTKIAADKYADLVESNVATSERCDLNSEKTEKIFDRDSVDAFNYALDLRSDEFAEVSSNTLVDDVKVDVTSEKSGGNTYYSKVGDNRETETVEKRSIAEATTYGELEKLAAENGYLKNIFANDFEGKFPFGTEDTRGEMGVIMLLSTNGAAYTAKFESEELFTLEKGDRLLISFFVKTSSIRSGKTGAGVTLVDGENKTSISPFDTTTVSPVDIDTSDETLTDIYKGWVQCFFFVSNDTDAPKTFHLEFTYGPTSVAGTSVTDYCEGYAAFTNFLVMDLTKTQYGFASTGTYAQKVELTAYVENTSRFDAAEASSDIENELASPANFTGALAGSDAFKKNETSVPNVIPNGVYGGLLNSKHADNYSTSNADWAKYLSSVAGEGKTGSDWWSSLFGDGINPAYEANQPLVLVNTNDEATPSYGYVAGKTSLSANSSQRISVRVKVAAGTTAYIYLLDTSDLSSGFNTLLTPSIPAHTYWYDDEGNIVRIDPTSDEYDENTDVLFYLQTNGLYVSAADVDKAENQKTYYANLSSFEKDDDGNYITSDEVIAYYYNKADQKYYAYYDEDNGTYDRVVVDLPTEVNGESILRYNVTPDELNAYASVIAVTGTEENADNWVTVSFYVRAGSKAKNFRLEVWAGQRDYEAGVSGKDTGFAAGGYVFFDNYKSASVSNFAGLRTEAVDALLENKDNWADEDGEKLISSLARYYTFTLYDAASFLRHDRTLDETDLGSHWGSYNQSSYSEGIVWLQCFDPDGTLWGAEDMPTNPTYSVYLDYTPIDVTVTPDVLEEEDNDVTVDDDDEDSEPVNIWLVLSSVLLGVVVIMAVIAVIIRAIQKKAKKSGGYKPPKKKKAKKAAPVTPAPAPVEKAPEVTEDPNDPYNE